MTEPLKIFIGWDSREDIAYQVARFSLYNRASVPIDVQPIQQYEMRLRGIYTRPADMEGSTEFTLTRFLTPYLAGHKGLALFTDCDFLFQCDIKELFDLVRDHSAGKAITVVKHKYIPPESIKMEGQVQHQYPRKNWSSMMVFNCAHSDCLRLTPDLINQAPPALLHQFMWTEESNIGHVPYTWNFLEGWYPAKVDVPKIIHYTRGGPWLDDKFGWSNVDYAAEWIREKEEYQNLTKGRVI